MLGSAVEVEHERGEAPGAGDKQEEDKVTPGALVCLRHGKSHEQQVKTGGKQGDKREDVQIMFALLLCIEVGRFASQLCAFPILLSTHH